MSILVTGSSGNVGGAALRALREMGIEAVGTSSRAEVSGPDARYLDFTRPETFASALDGITVVVLVRPPAIGDVKSTLIPFIDTALRTGVVHIVFLSVVGAAANGLLPHTKVERHLTARGASATFLRAGFFAQNLIDTWGDDVVEDARLLLPAGNARIAFVDARDVGEAAAKSAMAAAPRGAVALDLTGAETTSLSTLASTISTTTGAAVRYEPCSALRFFIHQWRTRRMPALQAFIITLLHVGLRRNDEVNGAARVTDDLPAILGRPPRTMSAFVREHAAKLEPRAAAPDRPD